MGSNPIPATNKIQMLLTRSFVKSYFKKLLNKKSPMNTGKVKFFNETKGYGFITGDDGKEYFVHVSNCNSKLMKGDDVSFEAKETPKGLNAIQVNKL